MQGVNQHVQIYSTATTVLNNTGKSSKAAWLSACLLAIGLAIAFFKEFDSDSRVVLEAGPSQKDIIVRYGFTLRNRSDQSLTEVSFKTFAPIQSTPFQSLKALEATLPFEREFDESGNQTLSFLIKEIPPFGQKIVTITVHLKMWSNPGVEYSINAIESDSTRMAKGEPALARVLDQLPELSATEGRLDWIRSAHQWVHTNMKDIGYVSEDRGPRYALQELKGDCTEFMHAFLSIARAEKIPALGVAGFRVSGTNAILEATDYHNWALFQSEHGSGWHLSDPHGDVFNLQTQNYVAFRFLDTSVFKEQNSQRFFGYDPRIEVVMN